MDESAKTVLGILEGCDNVCGLVKHCRKMMTAVFDRLSLSSTMDTSTWEILAV